MADPFVIYLDKNMEVCPKEQASLVRITEPTGKSYFGVIKKQEPTENFDPDQPRDETGKWTKGGLFFHGTVGDVMGKILKEGIKPQEKHRFEEHLYEGERGKSVFVMKGKRRTIPKDRADLSKDPGFKEALEYARFAMQKSGQSEGAVLVVSVPKGTSLDYDAHAEMGVEGPIESGAKAYSLKGEIKPEWIKGYVSVSWEGMDEAYEYYEPQDYRKELLKNVEGQDDQVHYVVVLWGDKTQTVNFDPDQPRDEGGKWTNGGGSISGKSIEELLPAYDRWFESRSPEQKQALAHWGGSYQGCAQIRAVESGEMSTPSVELSKTVAAFQEAMVSAPRYEGVVFRGLALKRGETERLFAVGQMVSWKAHSSATTTFDQAERYLTSAGDRTVLKVRTSGARMFNDFEVLLPLGKKYRVTGVTRSSQDKRLVTVEMEETP